MKSKDTKKRKPPTIYCAVYEKQDGEGHGLSLVLKPTIGELEDAAYVNYKDIFPLWPYEDISEETRLFLECIVRFVSRRNGDNDGAKEINNYLNAIYHVGRKIGYKSYKSPYESVDKLRDTIGSNIPEIRYSRNTIHERDWDYAILSNKDLEYCSLELDSYIEEDAEFIEVVCFFDSRHPFILLIDAFRELGEMEQEDIYDIFRNVFKQGSKSL